MELTTRNALNAPEVIQEFGIRAMLNLPVVTVLIAKTHQTGGDQDTDNQLNHQQDLVAAERLQERRAIMVLPMRCVQRALWEILVFGILATVEANVQVRVVRIHQIGLVN